MPKALDVDRALIAGLYLQGFTPAVIARKTGLKAQTVNTWSKRYGWAKTKDKAAEFAVNQTLERLSAHSRERLAQQTSADIDAVDRATGRQAAELDRKVRTRSVVIANAERVFGWNEERGGEQHLALAGLSLNVLDVESSNSVTEQRNEIQPANPGDDPVNGTSGSSCAKSDAAI